MKRDKVIFIAGLTLLCVTFLLTIAAIVLNFVKIEDSPTDEFAIVTTFNGKIRGHKRATLYNQNPYYAFKGIPYARPPVGSLRFKPPQRALPWSNVRDALEFGNECVQGTSTGNLDCLYINVYTPKLDPDEKLPVIIAIHGGAFYGGSANEYGPDFMLNEADVVVVTFNYRVGPFGFLSMGTAEYSGNMGLKDQLLAIKWTIENVYNFGGDKDKITLHGLSAGSVSAHLHILSSASKGLFKRAILTSGTANLPWAVQMNSQIPRLQEFAARNGHPNLNNTQLIEYLETVEPHLLTSQTNGQFYNPGQGRIEHSLLYLPVVEHPDAFEPFMLESPMRIIENDSFVSDVDVMFGVAARESDLYVAEEFSNPKLLEQFNLWREVQLPMYEMNVNLTYSSEEYTAISMDIMGYYFGPNSTFISVLSDSAYCNLWSEVVFGYGIDRAVRMQANASTANTFFYRFNMDSELNLLKLSTNAKELGWFGATHGDEHYYTFGASDTLKPFYNALQRGSMERLSIKYISSKYMNFVYNGSLILDREPFYAEPIQANNTSILYIENLYSFVVFIPTGSSYFWEPLFDRFNLW